jgi:hypothetical protein
MIVAGITLHLVQVQMVDRILGLQGRQPIIADPQLVWPVGGRDGARAKVTPANVPQGFAVLRLGDRMQLHQVGHTLNVH